MIINGVRDHRGLRLCRQRNYLPVFIRVNYTTCFDFTCRHTINCIPYTRQV